MLELVDAQAVRSYQILDNPSPSLPRSNSVSDIEIRRDSVWVGSGKGLDLTTNGGITWQHFSNTATFDEKTIAGIGILNNRVAVAVATISKQDGESLPTGGGLHISLDRGLTWSYRPQSVDAGLVDTILYGINKIPALAITTAVNNITYDLALTSNAIWTANFAGMLRKKSSDGQTWDSVVVLPPDNLNSISPHDTLKFHLSPTTGKSGLVENLNHRVFSVYAPNDTVIWVGTAGGINKSTDGGISWRKFSHQNQDSGISGNFVVAIREQKFAGKTILWAATVNAELPNEVRGVSFTTNDGASWNTTLLGEFAHNIAFKDSIVYVVTDNGAFRSSDRGTSWLRSGTISSGLLRFASDELFAVGVKGDTVWVGGPEGLAYTIDSPSIPFGTTWKIFRTYLPTKSPSETYAYPVPFSPDDEVVRIHFNASLDAFVSIRIFDFSMQPVRVVLNKATGRGPESDEIWDGRDDNGRRVANGPYFYSVRIGDGEPEWGKILVVQ
jgi:hypothetical protein